MRTRSLLLFLVLVAGLAPARVIADGPAYSDALCAGYALPYNAPLVTRTSGSSDKLSGEMTVSAVVGQRGVAVGAFNAAKSCSVEDDTRGLVPDREYLVTATVSIPVEGPGAPYASGSKVDAPFVRAGSRATVAVEFVAFYMECDGEGYHGSARIHSELIACSRPVLPGAVVCPNPGKITFRETIRVPADASLEDNIGVRVELAAEASVLGAGEIAEARGSARVEDISVTLV